jgi:hypothetical protein
MPSTEKSAQKRTEQKVIDTLRYLLAACDAW